MRWLEEIEQRWAAPASGKQRTLGVRTVANAPSDIARLVAEIKRLQQLEAAVRTYRRGPRDWRRGDLAYLQDIDDALDALDESEVRG